MHVHLDWSVALSSRPDTVAVFLLLCRSRLDEEATAVADLLVKFIMA